MRNQLQIEEFVVSTVLLGRGSYGEVYEGFNSKTKERLAVKLIKAQSNTDRSFKVLKSQVDLLQKVRGPNIVKFYGAKKVTGGDHYIFLQYCESDLKRHLQSLDYFHEKDILDILKQICNGYKLLYQSKIMHRDIKPENILLHEGVFKIADFGFGRLVDNPDEISKKTLLGTVIYTAPQILERQPYSAKCDIWSLGVLLHEMMYFKKPFEAKSQLELQKLVTKKLQLPENPVRSEILKQLVLKMLQVEEKDRIDWPDLFTHELIQNSEELDVETMNTLSKVGKTIKFYKELCVYINTASSYFSKFQSQMSHRLYLIGLMCLVSYNTYLCKATVNLLFSKKLPKEDVSEEEWISYKRHNEYWIYLKQVKSNCHLIQSFFDSIKQQLKSQITTIDNKKIRQAVDQLQDINEFKYDRYVEVIEWVVEELKLRQCKLPLFMLKMLEICKNPLIYFSCETNFDKVHEALQNDLKVAEMGGR